MIFSLKDNDNVFGGKEFDWDHSKNFLKNIKDKIFVTPTEEQLSMVEKYNRKLQKETLPLAKDYIESIKDSDPIMHSYFTTLNGGIATQKGMKIALNRTTIAAKGAALGMQLLKSAATMAVSAGIAFAISIPFYIAEANKKALLAAKESTKALEEDSSSLDNYKTKLSQLQGYYYSKPMPHENFTDLIKTLKKFEKHTDF